MDEYAVIEELRRSWSHLNRSLLRGALRPPVIEITGGEVALGRYQASTRTLGISRQLVQQRPWVEVLEVLRHEVAHQYAIEVLGGDAERPHGPAFARAAARLGVAPQATASPEQGVVRRVRALLALAQSPERHEAEAAAAAAHRLLRRHNIALEDHPRPEDWEVRGIGPVKGRFDAWEKALAGLITQHFFVWGVWVPALRVSDRQRGRVLEISGRPENVAMATYAFDFLRATGERLWAEHRRTRALRGNRQRRTFLAGVMAGFDARLAQEARTAEETGLVWRGDPHLDAWVRVRHPHLRRGRRGSVRGTTAYWDGHRQGQEIVLHRPVGEGPGSKRPRLTDARSTDSDA